MNNINLIGRLTADPELTVVKGGDGTHYVRFTLAVSRTEEDTDFIPCIAWSKTASFINEWFVKGERMGVTGSLRSSNYQDEDGNNRTYYSVNVYHAYFCESNSEKTNEPPRNNNGKGKNRRK